MVKNQPKGKEIAIGPNIGGSTQLHLGLEHRPPKIWRKPKKRKQEAGQTSVLRDQVQPKSTQEKDIDPLMNLTVPQRNRENVIAFPITTQNHASTVVKIAAPLMGDDPTIHRPPTPTMGVADSPQILGSLVRPPELNGKEVNVGSTNHGDEEEVVIETQNMEDETMVT
ncbi:hypothetical protein TSUD_97120 [Trifolium subterraneum]|nr:hypothetical protein TSUD_97120 [Trifolium subterraneum]